MNYENINHNYNLAECIGMEFFKLWENAKLRISELFTLESPFVYMFVLVCTTSK